jgi:hypothetical protein
MPALHDLLQPVLDGLDAARRAAAARALGGAAARGRRRPGGPAPGRARLPVAACGAPGQPCCSPIDDWQWLDAATAAVLTFVLRRLEPGGAKVIATVRSGEADDALAALVRALPEGTRWSSRSRRSTPALAALVHARTGERLSPPVARAPARGVRGQPLDGARADPRAGAGTATDVRRLLGRRIAALPPDCRALLRVVAALAEPTVDAGRRSGLEAALAADVLVRDGHRLRFTHPLIAAVVEERTPPSEWRAIHARLAEEARTPEQRARHLAAAA